MRQPMSADARALHSPSRHYRIARLETFEENDGRFSSLCDLPINPVVLRQEFGLGLHVDDKRTRFGKAKICPVPDREGLDSRIAQARIGQENKPLGVKRLSFDWLHKL